MKIARTIAIAALAAGISAGAEAGNLDTYRNLLLNRTYTIRYENITPPPRVTNRDSIPLYGKSGINAEANALLTNRQRTGLVTANGDSKYEEVIANGPKGDFYTCHLQKGDEDFFFTKYMDKDKWQYVGNKKKGVKKGEVEAVKRNVLGEMVNGESFGEDDLTRLLSAMLPDGKKSASMPRFTQIGSGWLENGLNYEDYSAETGGGLDVIRYYFNQYTLVKIAEATYYMTEDGKYAGRRCIIKIDEFSPTPDAALLRLPEGLEDVTKRDEKGDDKND